MTSVLQSEVIFDNSLSSTENNYIRRFQAASELFAAKNGVDPQNGYTMDGISCLIGLPINDYHKEGLFVQGIWVTYFRIMRRYESCIQGMIKYGNLADFHKSYNYLYCGLNISEQELLRQTANWMSILFTMISSRKNKGLAMQVIPKLVEGWSAKYVTGSGQTKATAHRVHIFETEGCIQADHRGTRGKGSVKRSRPEIIPAKHRGEGRHKYGSTVTSVNTYPHAGNSPLSSEPTTAIETETETVKSLESCHSVVKKRKLSEDRAVINSEHPLFSYSSFIRLDVLRKMGATFDQLDETTDDDSDDDSLSGLESINSFESLSKPKTINQKPFAPSMKLNDVCISRCELQTTSNLSQDEDELQKFLSTFEFLDNLHTSRSSNRDSIQIPFCNDLSAFFE